MKTNNVRKVYITTTKQVYDRRKVTTDEVYYEFPSQVPENLKLLQNPHTK